MVSTTDVEVTVPLVVDVVDVVDVVVASTVVSVLLEPVDSVDVESIDVVVVVAGAADVLVVASSVVAEVAVVVEVVSRGASEAVVVVVDVASSSPSNSEIPPRVELSRTLRLGVATTVDTVGAPGNPSALSICIALIASGAATAAAVTVESENASRKRLLPADLGERC